MHAAHHPSATTQAKGPIEQVRRNGCYGMDAPYLLPILGALLAANVVQGVVSRSVWPFVGALVVLEVRGLRSAHLAPGGKFVAWAELLDQLEFAWR